MARYLILAATFISAFLLFSIQPLFAKYLLPNFGGTSSVWTISVFFYSAILLLGYIFAAFLTQIKTSFATMLHGGLLVAVLGIFACRIAGDINPIMTGALELSAPALSVLATLLFALGMPVLLLASTSVLSQYLYTKVSDRNPYLLYALSNVGSLSALLLYPFIIEPFVSLSAQVAVWVLGFILYAVIMIGAWYFANRSSHIHKLKQIDDTRSLTFPIAQVIFLAAIPTFFLTAATEQISRGIASFPLLWILPLCLYLLSFIISFRDTVRRLGEPVVLVSAGVALWSIPLFIKGPYDYWFGVLVLSVSFFIVATYLHRSIYELRPSVKSLGLFYVILTAGGALGSGVVGLVLPAVFNDYYELPILLAALMLFFLRSLLNKYFPKKIRWDVYVSACIAFILIVSFGFQLHSLARKQIASDRSFYGTLKITEKQKHIGDDIVPVRYISNGATYHGQQVLDERYMNVAGSYYGEGSGIDIAIRSLVEQGVTPRISVIGLGAGMMNVYCDAFAGIDYVDINPSVENFARQYFTYLDSCTEKTTVTIRDGRLHLEALAKHGDKKYDIIMVDAFTDDTIPMHLLTREAFLKSYSPLLTEQGMIVIHVSNRYINLLPTISATAESIGLATMRYENKQDEKSLGLSTVWAIVTKPENTELLKNISSSLKVFALDGNESIWTDEKSSILSALSWHGSYVSDSQESN